MPDPLPAEPAGPIMWTFWVKNGATGEAAQFLGQGNTVEAAFKDGWTNANEDFGKSSSGAPPIARAKLAVRLADGRRVERAPSKFQSREPYVEGENPPVPVCSGAAARPYDGPMRSYRKEESK